MKEFFFFRYGYVTNTKIKFVVIVESSHTTLRDNEIRQVSSFFIYIMYTHTMNLFFKGFKT